MADMLPAHALTGCDTVPMCYGFGKGRMINTLQGAGKCSLTLLGNTNDDSHTMCCSSPQLLSQHVATCMMQHPWLNQQLKLGQQKTRSKGVTATSKLCTLPPTNEAFKKNVKRAHIAASGDVPYNSSQTLFYGIWLGKGWGNQVSTASPLFLLRLPQHQITYSSSSDVLVLRKVHASL